MNYISIWLIGFSYDLQNNSVECQFNVQLLPYLAPMSQDLNLISLVLGRKTSAWKNRNETCLIIIICESDQLIFLFHNYKHASDKEILDIYRTLVQQHSCCAIKYPAIRDRSSWGHEI